MSLPRLPSLALGLRIAALAAAFLACRGATVVPATAPVSPANLPTASAPFDVRPGFHVIDSVAQLRAAMQTSGQKIRMKPGIYRVDDALTDNQTVFRASGSHNHFDLRGVTLQLDTAVLARMTAKTAHELVTYRIAGDHLTFEGARFENIGDQPPAISLPEFDVEGDDVVFQTCSFIVRGSAPYGYGRLFGKGKGRGEFKPTLGARLQKHSAMSIRGDRSKIIGCSFSIQTFGHAISIHGAQDTLVQDTFIEGTLRPTEEILRETSGPAFEQKFIDMFHRPIPPGLMLALAEDGIRAYNNGTKNGQTRRTGTVTALGCTVKRMRGAISLSLASKPARVENCTVLESGWTGDGYNLPSGSIVKNCRGDSAYSPLLNQSRSNKRDVDITLEVLDGPTHQGIHPLAIINGSGHRITLTQHKGKSLAATQTITLGMAGADASAGDEDGESRTGVDLFAKGVRLTNETHQPVLLTENSSACVITTAGPVADKGRNNTVNHLSAAASATRQN